MNTNQQMLLFCTVLALGFTYIIGKGIGIGLEERKSPDDGADK